jgi:tetratricopeptide (TPR) repeat protein
MGKVRRRKTRPLEGKGIKRPVPKGKDMRPAHSGEYNLAVAFFLITLTVLIAAYSRNNIWKDEETVWADVTRKSPNKMRGYNNLGLAYKDNGLLDKALQEYRKALRLSPGFAKANYNPGNAYDRKGRVDETKVHYNIGNVYAAQGRTDEAIEEFQLALRLIPYFAQAHNNLGNAYARKGRTDDAIEQYQTALRLKPDYVKAHNNLGAVYASRDRMDEAIEEFIKALRLEPDFPEAHLNLGLAYKIKGLKNEAITEFEEVLKLNPQAEEARKILQSLQDN